MSFMTQSVKYFLTLSSQQSWFWTNQCNTKCSTTSYKHCSLEEVGHSWPLLVRSLTRVPFGGILIRFLAHDMKGVKSVWVVVHVVRSSWWTSWSCARNVIRAWKGTLVSDLTSKGQACPTSFVVLSPDPTLSRGETIWWTKSNFLD